MSHLSLIITLDDFPSNPIKKARYFLEFNDEFHKENLVTDAEKTKETPGMVNN